MTSFHSHLLERSGEIETEENFQQVKKDTWASANSIFSYHSSMIQVLGHADKHPIHRQVRWYPPKDGI